MKLPTNFITNIQSNYGVKGVDWLRKLPEHINALAELWKFRMISVMPELSYSFIATVQSLSPQQIAILKIAPPEQDLLLEANWLMLFADVAPAIFNVNQKYNAVMMQHLTPGTTLKQLVKEGRDIEATEIIAHSILALQRYKPRSTSLACKHLHELMPSLNHLKKHIPSKMYCKVMSIFSELTLPNSNDILLHGDLHHDNILQHEDNWKIIDPHGYIGDPAAEVGAMFYNPLDCFPTRQPLKRIIDGRLSIFTEILSFDFERIKAWAFCYTLLSAAWDIEGFGKILSNKLEIATIINQKLK